MKITQAIHKENSFVNNISDLFTKMLSHFTYSESENSSFYLWQASDIELYIQHYLCCMRSNTKITEISKYNKCLYLQHFAHIIQTQKNVSDHLIAKRKKENEIKKTEMKINVKNMQIFQSRGQQIQRKKFLSGLYENENLPSFGNYNDLHYIATADFLFVLLHTKKNYGSHCLKS